MTMSQQAARPTAPPKAAPCTRPITGLDRWLSTFISRASSRESSRFSWREFSAIRRIQPRSAPAEKCLPSERRITTLTLLSAFTSVRVLISCWMITSSKALRLSGRLRTTSAMPSSRRLSRTADSLSVMSVSPITSGTRQSVSAGGSVKGGRQAQGNHFPGLGRVDDAVVPEAGTGVVRVALVFVGVDDRLLEFSFFLGAPFLALALHAFPANSGHNAGGLFAAAHRDAGVRPHPEEIRAVGTAAHAVVASAEGATDQYGDLRYVGTGYGHDHFGAMLGNAFGFVFLANHEPGDILQEQQRDVALAAQFNEVGAFLGGFAEQDAVVGDDAHRVAVDMGKAGDQGLAVIAFEFVKLGTVDGAGDDVTHVELLAQVGANDAVDLLGVVQRCLGLADFHIRWLATVQVGDAAPGDFQGVGVVLGVVVGNTGDFTVYVGATKVFGADYFTGGGFYQRRAGQEDGALITDDDGFVGHGRNVGANGGTQAHNDSDLRDVVGRHAGLVKEDAAEVVAIREYFVLSWQVGTAGVDQVDARQAVLQGDFLGSQVFLDGQRVVAAAFYGGVVGDDHAFGAGDAAHAGDHACCGDFFIVDVVGGKLADFQERGAVVQEAVDALSGE